MGEGRKEKAETETEEKIDKKERKNRSNIEKTRIQG